jgi:hypothetical protein
MQATSSSQYMHELANTIYVNHQNDPITKSCF